LKKHNSPGSDQTPAELIQARGEILLFAIHKLVNSIWNKDELPEQWKESVIVPVHKKDDKTDCNNYREVLLLSTSYKNSIEYPALKVKSIHRSNYWGSSMWVSTQEIRY
jgi:hypothetical protein